jgi:hypothetical protein
VSQSFATPHQAEAFTPAMIITAVQVGNRSENNVAGGLPGKRRTKPKIDGAIFK